jgi:hypothetical protein
VFTPNYKRNNDPKGLRRKKLFKESPWHNLTNPKRTSKNASDAKNRSPHSWPTSQGKETSAFNASRIMPKT